MAEYKYEMHTHTSEGSRDSDLSGKGMVEYYIKRGYSGVCITDHFTGSITRPLDKPWNEQMDVFCSGYENALKASEGTGFKVFFGIELSDKGNDFLLLNLDKAWLKRNPDMLEISLKDLLSRVRSDGGFVIHAHPFLQSDWIEMVRLLPNHVDAVEVLNTNIEPEANARAQWYANSFNLKATGGSDLHHNEQRPISGIITSKPANTVKELTDMVRAGETTVIR